MQITSISPYKHYKSTEHSSLTQEEKNVLRIENNDGITATADSKIKSAIFAVISIPT
jgi:hypothetical protein